MEKLQAKVTVGEQSFRFEVQLHFSNCQTDLKMETKDFYQKWGKIPVGDHYEMEILNLPVEASEVKLHIHPVGEERFLCWTQQIPTIEDAKKMFKVWCLGSSYTIVQEKDFQSYLFKENIKGIVEKFEDSLAEEFGMKFEFE